MRKGVNVEQVIDQLITPDFSSAVTAMVVPALVIVLLEIIVRIDWLPSYQMPAPSEILLNPARPGGRCAVEAHQRQPVGGAQRLSDRCQSGAGIRSLGRLRTFRRP